MVWSIHIDTPTLSLPCVRRTLDIIRSINICRWLPPKRQVNSIIPERPISFGIPPLVSLVVCLAQGIKKMTKMGWGQFELRVCDRALSRNNLYECEKVRCFLGKRYAHPTLNGLRRGIIPQPPIWQRTAKGKNKEQYHKISIE